MRGFIKGLLMLSGFVGLSGTVAYNVSPEVRSFVNPAIQNHYCPELRVEDSTEIARLNFLVDSLKGTNDSLTRANREIGRRSEIVGHQLDVPQML